MIGHYSPTLPGDPFEVQSLTEYVRKIPVGETEILAYHYRDNEGIWSYFTGLPPRPTTVIQYRWAKERGWVKG